MPKNKRKIILSVILLHLAQSTLAQQLVTEGQMSVSSQGSLQYTVPIKVPAGTNGMQPNITLTYDSRSGNGNMYGGWSLTGFPKITRCPRTLAQDGVSQPVSFTADDRYCLDGERLIAVQGVNGMNGTEYRTERDMFAKIVSSGSYIGSYKRDSAGNDIPIYGGPVSFLVYTKSGQTMEFGTSDDSQLTKYGSQMITVYADKANPVRAWAVKKVSDVYGNYMTYTYEKKSDVNQVTYPGMNDGTFYPAWVEYGGNWKLGTLHRMKIRFNWDPLQQDAAIRFADGFALPRTGPFPVSGSIMIYGNEDQLYKQYNILNGLSLERFRVSSISECNEPGYSCLPAVSFEYEPQGNLFKYFTSVNTFHGVRQDYKSFFVDVNGTGKKHWVQISEGVDEAWIGEVNSDGTMSAENWRKYSQSIGSVNQFEHYFVDVNGDGKSDWIRVSRTTNEGWVALGTGGGDFQFWTTYTQAIGAANNYSHNFVDINGDGRADWVQSSRTAAHMVIGLALPGGDFQFWTATSNVLPDPATVDRFFVDLNGDGKADLVTLNRSNGSLLTYLSTGDGNFGNVKGYPASPGKVHFMDVNGDGLEDVFIRQADRWVKYAMSQGNGALTSFYPFADTNGFDQVLDVDGDGKFEFAATSDHGVDVTISRVTGFGDPSSKYEVAPLETLPQTFTPYDRYYADVTGDGKSDLIMVNRANRQNLVSVGIGENRNLLKSISYPQRTPTVINYKSLSDGPVYSTDSNAVYPQRDAVYPLLGVQRAPLVVSSVVSPNGLGGTLTTNYTYGGLKTDLARRQVMGFRWMQSKQVETGITVKTELRQDWPYTGNVATVTKSLAGAGNNGMLSQTVNIYGCNDFVTTDGTCTVAIGRRYWPYLSQSTSSAWDLNGAALPSGSASYVYDSFGNATRVSTSTTDGHSKVVDTTYSNDTSNWWIGKPLRVTETVTAP